MAFDYAQLAKRIADYTSKGLLTALVLVAGLGFGQQVIRWWSADDTEPGTAVQLPAADGLGDPFRAHLVRFGDQPWSLRRQSIAGDRPTAIAALREAARDVVRAGAMPGDRAKQAEIEFLTRLAEREPVEQEAGKWRLYELNEAIPMVVGSRPPGPEAGGQAGKNPVPTGHRVVTWAVAMPTGHNAWTLCTFQPKNNTAEGSETPLEIPVPDGCRRILSMQVAGGGSLVSFDGPQRAGAFIGHYDRWFGQHDWQAVGQWRRSGSSWQMCYVAPEQDPAASAHVHFGTDRRGRLTGLLMVTPKAQEK